jgi:hypothetical protein
VTESVCIRCGKTRVFSRKWKDSSDVKGSPVTHVETVCPDVECQKVVDEKFAKMRELRAASEDKRRNLTLAKSAASAAAKLAKANA